MNTYAHRRGSIFWALTLIAVGAIFLYQNFDPTIRAWQIIGKFWPILIIFWGLSKLIDYVQAQAHPETVAPPLFSASEVILLVLVLILGTTISKIVLRPWPHWPGGIFGDEDFGDLFLDSYSYTRSFTQPVPAQPHLLLVNRRGDIEVRGGDQSNFEVVVKETIRAENEEAAKKISDQLKFEFIEQAGRWVFQSNLKSVPPGKAGEGLVVDRSVRMDIVLRVPKGTSAEITAERGDVTLDGLQGNQTLLTKKGDVRVANVEGLVKLRKSSGTTEIRDVKGNVEVEGRGRDVDITGVTGTVTVMGEFSGGSQFRNIAQSLRFNSSRTEMMVQKLSGQLNLETRSLDASGIDGPFEIRTRQKDITLENFRHSVRITNTNGDIRLRTSVAPTHPLDVVLEKGEIDLTLPAACNFEIDARSRRGEVQSDFAGPNLKVSKEGDAPSITGSFGKGGPSIRLSTAYGTIRLMRQGSLASPPAPPSKGEKQARVRPPRPERPAHFRFHPVRPVRLARPVRLDCAPAPASFVAFWRRLQSELFANLCDKDLAPLLFRRCLAPVPI